MVNITNNQVELAYLDDLWLDYDRGEIKQKILKLLRIGDINEDVVVREYISSFIRKNYIECEIKESVNNTVYTIKLNKDWIEELYKIKNYLILKNILEFKMWEKFEYRKTIKALHRYNNNQENEELKIKINLYSIKKEILSLKIKVSWDDMQRLKDIESNYLLEIEKEKKFEETSKQLAAIYLWLSISTDNKSIMDVINKYNLKDLYEREISNYNKQNFEYNIEVKKDKERNINKDIDNKSVLLTLWEYKKSVFTVLGFSVLIGYNLLADNNTSKQKSYMDQVAENKRLLSQKVIYSNLGSQKVLENHQYKFFKSMPYHYLNLLENNKLHNISKEAYFMNFNESFFLLHFRNLPSEKIIDAKFDMTYNEEKSIIDIKWFFQVYEGTKYFIDSDYKILSDKEYSKLTQTEEYKDFKELHKAFDKHLWKNLWQVMDSISDKDSPEYGEVLREEIKKHLETMSFEELYKKWLINSDNHNYIKMVNHMEIEKDWKLLTHFIIFVNDISFVLTYRL